MFRITLLHIASVYLGAVNLAAFILFGIDKYKAKHDRWRVREAVLMGLAVLGGSLGAWLGMIVWHHKTQHTLFTTGIPLILLAQLIAAMCWLFYC